MANRPTRHTIDCHRAVSFEIWNEKGKVRQNGRFSLPEYLVEFSDTKVGRLEAGAFISGMLEMQRIIKG